MEPLRTRIRRIRGTLLVVSHDRAFLDNVVTSTLVFEGGENPELYRGDPSEQERAYDHPEARRGKNYFASAELGFCARPAGSDSRTGLAE